MNVRLCECFSAQERAQAAPTRLPAPRPPECLPPHAQQPFEVAWSYSRVVVWSCGRVIDCVNLTGSGHAGAVDGPIKLSTAVHVGGVHVVGVCMWWWGVVVMGGGG